MRTIHRLAVILILALLLSGCTRYLEQPTPPGHVPPVGQQPGKAAAP